MRRRKHKLNKMFSLSRGERQIFHLIAELIRLLVFIICSIFKGIYKLSRLVRKNGINREMVHKIGYSMDDIMNLVYKVSPRQFEVLIAQLFKNTGEYDKVELTPPKRDYGRDVILTRYINGSKEITFVEVKHFAKNNMVGRVICQKLLGSCQMLKAQKAVIVTTGKYHKNAIECASLVDNLVLMNVRDIQDMILDLEPNKISHVIMATLNANE